ncbi:hypothetical protein ACVWZB_004783 [Paenibacillus polymyxa]
MKNTIAIIQLIVTTLTGLISLLMYLNALYN